MKTVAFFIVYGNFKNYTFWCENSVNSFKKWHPEIDVVIFDEIPTTNHHTLFYKHAKTLFDKGYDKVLHVNSDTITCARFDELLADTTDIVGALDCLMDPCGYRHQVNKYAFHNNYLECKNINAGLLCFNRKEIIDELIEINNADPSLGHEQGAVQYLLDTQPHKVKVIDFPYVFSRFVYNSRGLGTVGTGCMRDGKLYFGFDGPCIGDVIPLSIYTVNDGKLFNHLGKHVKMIHLCGDYKDPKMKSWFNAQTIEFFETHCACDWSLPVIKT
jgi:hypothetical protein